MKWLRKYGFKRHPGGYWSKTASTACSALLHKPDELGWECVINHEVDLPDSTAMFAGLKTCGCGITPRYALEAAIQGLYELQDALSFLRLDGALINLSNPKGK